MIDGTPVKGAGAVQDTYTLVRKGIRKLLKAAGYQVPSKRRGLSPQARTLVERYVVKIAKPISIGRVHSSGPRSSRCSWPAPKRPWSWPCSTATMQVRGIGWLLAMILGDDIVTDEQGDLQIGDGTAPDRVISVTDPQMRHGRKTKSQRFDGFKALTATDQSSELILDIADITASGSEGAEMLLAVERVEANAQVVVERVIGDGAFGSGEVRAACDGYEKERKIDLVAPMAHPQDAEVAKSAFSIDLEAATATCPQGHIVAGRPGPKEDGRPAFLFSFPRVSCQACILFERCVRSKKSGRTVRTRAHEPYLQAARARQETVEFKALYRLRPAVERKQAELVGHGLRDTRYLGEPQRQFQRLWTGAAVSLKRRPVATGMTGYQDLRTAKCWYWLSTWPCGRL